MTWLQKYRLVSFVRTSVWLPSLIGLLAALAANRLMESVDRMLPWPSRVGVDGARILLTSLSSSMLTFIVFVFSILLLTVQLASAQLTPRVIATSTGTGCCGSRRPCSSSLHLRPRGHRPHRDRGAAAVGVARDYLSVASIGVFLYMIERSERH